MTNTSPTFARGDRLRVRSACRYSIPDALIGGTVTVVRVGQTGTVYFRETAGPQTLYLCPPDQVTRCLELLRTRDIAP